jgi:Predicted phosphoesterases, related to the Icc protein
MKIFIQSDQHHEIFDPDPVFSLPDADVFVCAGDLTRTIKGGIQWLAENVGPKMPSVYVAGNHEYYKESYLECHAEGLAENKLHERVHLLENDIKVIGDVRFVGCTLWTDFAVMGQQPLAVLHAQKAMNDYKYIKYRKLPFEKLQPQHTMMRHSQSVSFLQAALSMPFEGKTVVVTHHAPHPWSIHERYRHDLLSAAFCSDLSELIETYQPALWIHGHTHNSFDYSVGETRVVCNPKGYGGENPEFDPGLVIEI